MKQDNVIGLKSPGMPSAASDALTDLLRDGARQMAAAAVEAEVHEFLARHQALQDEQGRQRLVRNGYLPQRTIQTGLGDIEVKAPRVRDRAKEIKFSSARLPPYLRRTNVVIASTCRHGKKPDILSETLGHLEKTALTKLQRM